MVRLRAAVKKVQVVQKVTQDLSLERGLQITLMAELPEGDDGDRLVAELAGMQGINEAMVEVSDPGTKKRGAA